MRIPPRWELLVGSPVIQTLLCLPAVLYAQGGAGSSHETDSPGSKNDPPRFEKDVQPILVDRCLSCHGREKQRGGVDLRSLSFMTRDDWPGAVLVPGSPEDSSLFLMIALGEMPPPDQPPLTDKEIETIRQWIAAGAPADHPDRIYGAGFYQAWGIPLLAIGLVNLSIIVAASVRRHANGYHVMFLGMLPMVLIGLSAFSWYPPDSLSRPACLAMLLGLGIGGAMVSKEKGYGIGRGVGLALFPPCLGLAILAFRPEKPEFRGHKSEETPQRSDGSSRPPSDL